MNLRVFDDLEALSQAAARTIMQRVAELPAAVIALSGGSTPKRLYQLLCGRLDARPVTWVVVDERHVPLEHPRSNAAMMLASLFPDGIAPGHRFLRFRTETGDAAATAQAFEAEWREAGIERIDLAILGCGDDGHTASLFPGVPVSDEGIAQPVFVPKLDEWRVTLTMPVLQSASFQMVLAAGASKAPIIHDVRAGVDHPVALVTRGAGECWWFVDRAAYPAED